ncbi:site-specific tyrosine recombinase XerC [compost metagenome]
MPVDPALALTIAPLIQACAPEDYIFKMKQDGQTHSQAVHNKVWKPALVKAKAAGLKKSPRIHDLRHTYASWMLAGGMSIFELSRLMGHESVNTTSNVYSHLMPESLRKGSLAMGKAMDGLHDIKTQAEIDAETLQAIEQ